MGYILSASDVWCDMTTALPTSFSHSIFPRRCPQILSCIFHLLKSSKVLSTHSGKQNKLSRALAFSQTQDDFSLCHCYSHQKLHKTLIFSVSNHKWCHFYPLQEKLKRMIKLLKVIPFRDRKHVILLSRRQRWVVRTQVPYAVWLSFRATADYDGVTLTYFHRGQKLRFSHYIFCFKMGLLKEIG